MKKPLVSILMTIYNHEDYLAYAIKSILHQNFSEWELVAIDNGSTDETKKILKSFKDKRIKKKFLKKNIGRTNCLNFGLNLCRGKYIAILDSDDIAKKNRIKKQIEEFLSDKSLELVCSNYNLINKKNIKIGTSNIKKNLQGIVRKILFLNVVAHSTIMFKKSILKKIGKYPKNFKYAQDYIFFLKVLKKYKVKILEEALVSIRKNHVNSEAMRSIRTNTSLKEEIKILKWNLRNFNVNINERLIIYYNLLKKIIKIKLKTI